MAGSRTLSTKALTRSFGWEGGEAFQQHDVQELARVLFDALETGMKGTAHADLMQNLFKGRMLDYKRCNECKRERSTQDIFLDLSLVIKNDNGSFNGSIEEALRAYVQPEVLEGGNAVGCDHCAKRTATTKGLKIREPPYLLQLQLKRFTFDWQTEQRVKINEKVTFPALLDFNPFVALTPAQEAAAALPTQLFVSKLNLRFLVHLPLKSALS